MILPHKNNAGLGLSSHLLTSVADFFSTQGLEKTYWVAYSGGLDSHVLLSICYRLRTQLGIKLRAIHINHHLNPQAHAWAQHCAQVCAQYHIDFTERDIHLDNTSGVSIEEAARNMRYAIFAQYLDKEDMLLTAHHQDDQAETVMLQLLRGAGPKGLAAMPGTKPFAKGQHGRPLLLFSRAELQDYAETQQLQWINDESNLNDKYVRNFIRHTMFPLLQTRWPALSATLARTANHCAESQALLEEFALTISKDVKGAQHNALSVSKLLQLSSLRQRLILRSWIHSQGFPIPHTRKLHAIQHNVLQAKRDRVPCVSWQDVELRRYRDDIFLMPALLKHEESVLLTWDIHHPLRIADLGVLEARVVHGNGLRTGLPAVSVRFRQGGETVCLAKRGKHTLKNLFQEWSIPPWQRSRIPLIFVNSTLAAVPGYFIHPDFAAQQHEMGCEIVWKPLF